MDKKIKDDVIQTVKNLRILSMNIINHYLRIKESTSHHLINAKFDPEALNKLFAFDGNYILKMKNDTDFLFSSSLKKYFDFAPESDPFLIAISGGSDKDAFTAESSNIDNGNNNLNNVNNVKESKELNLIDVDLIKNNHKINNSESNSKINNKINSNDTNNDKITVKIPGEIAEMIKNCQFSILQELIYYEINGINNMKQSRIDVTPTANTTTNTHTTTGKSYVSIRSGKILKPVASAATKSNLNAAYTNLNASSGNSRVVYPLNNINAMIKNKVNSNIVKKSNLRPISENNLNNNDNNVNTQSALNNNNIYKSNVNNNNNTEFHLNNHNSKTPDNKNLLGNFYSQNAEFNMVVSEYNSNNIIHKNNNNLIKYNLLNNNNNKTNNTNTNTYNPYNNKKILNFNPYNANSSNLLKKNLEANSILNNKNQNSLINKKFGKLDNGITSYEHDNSFMDQHAIDMNPKSNMNQNSKELIMNDFKNIDSFLNDSKITKKTDTSNLLMNENVKNNNFNSNNNMRIVENVDGLSFPQVNSDSKRLCFQDEKRRGIPAMISNNNSTNNNNFNYADKVNLTDISANSHKINTPNANNKVVIKEKIYIEDKKLSELNNANNANKSSCNHININYNNSRELEDETEETGRILTKENLVRVSHELEKLRTDVLENHYISTLEKLNKINNSYSSKNKRNSKEKSSENIHVQNLRKNSINNDSNSNNPNPNANRAEIKSSSSTRKIKVIGGNLPPTPTVTGGVVKGKVLEMHKSANAKNSNNPKSAVDNSNNNAVVYGEGNFGNVNSSFATENNNNNIEENLISKNNDENYKVNKAKENEHEIINNQNKSSQQNKKNDNSNNNDDNNKNNKNNKNKEVSTIIKNKNNKRKFTTAEIKREAGCAKDAEDADISNLKSTEKSNLDNKTSFERDYIKDSYALKNESNRRITEKEDMHNLQKKNSNEIKEEEKPENSNILTLKLMKKIDCALLSSDEFSIKGDKLGQSQMSVSNRMASRINNLKEIKEAEKLVTEVNEECKSNFNFCAENDDDAIYRIKNDDFKITNLQSSSAAEAFNENHLTDYENNNNESKSINKNTDFKSSSFKQQQSQAEEVKVTEKALFKIETKSSLNDRKKNDNIPIDAIAQEAEKSASASSEPTIKISTNTLQELRKAYSEYIAEIDPEQKIIFNIADTIKSYLQGGFPKFVFIEEPQLQSRVQSQGKKLLSISTCHFDSNFSTGIRLVLSSFSTREPENYFKYVEKTVTFLKANFPNTEIYIELFYGIQSDKFYINEKLRDVFSKQLKFRWITLENTGMQRIVKYRLLNPEFQLEAVLNSKISNFNDYELNKLSAVDVADKDIHLKLLCDDVYSLVDVKINTTIAFRECEKIQERVEQEFITGGEGALSSLALASPREFTREETDVNIFPAIFLLSDLIHKSGYKVNNDHLRLFSNERTRVSKFKLIKFFT